MKRSMANVAAISLLALGACGRTGQSSPDGEQSWPVSCEEDDECDDGLVCSGLERCVDQRCVAGRPPECDDGDVATDDVCLEPVGCRFLRGGSDRKIATGGVGGALPGGYAGRVPDDCEGSLISQDVRATSPETLEALHGVRCIDGDLSIGGPLVGSLTDLDELRWVGGDVNIVDLPELTSLEGVDSLEYVGGSLRISNLSRLAELAPFASLREVSFDFTISQLDSLERLAGFESLVHVGGSLTIDDARLLEEASALAPHLKEIEGSLVLSRLPSLGKWHGFDELVRIGSELEMDAASFLRLSGFRHLEKLGWKLSLPETLISLKGFDRLEKISSLSLQLPVLEEFDAFHGLQDAGFELVIRAPQLEVLTGFEALRSAGKLVLTDVGKLRWVSGFSRIEKLEELYLYETILKRLPFEALRTCESIVLGENPVLEDLSSLAQVEGLLDISVLQNPALRSLDALGHVTELRSVSIERNLILAELNWSRLKSVSEGLHVSANPQLSRCEVDALLAAYDGSKPVSVCCNAGCEECEEFTCAKQGAPTSGQSGVIAAISGVGEDLAVYVNVTESWSVELKDYDDTPVALPNLKQVHGDITLSQVGWRDMNIFSGLESVAGKFDLFTAPNLVSLTGLEKLKTVGERLNISSSDELTEIALPALTSVGTELRAWGNDSLSECQLEALMSQLAEHGSTPTLHSEYNAVCSGVCQAGVCQ